MSRKKVWNKAVRKYGITKWTILLVLSPLIGVIYLFAFMLIFIGEVGDAIKYMIDNV